MCAKSWCLMACQVALSQVQKALSNDLSTSAQAPSVTFQACAQRAHHLISLKVCTDLHQHMSRHH